MHSCRPQQHKSRPTPSSTLLPTCTACTAVSLHHTPSNSMLSCLDLLFPFRFKGSCWPCQATFLRFETACRRHQARPGSISQHGRHSWHLCRCLQFAAAQQHQLVLPISANRADAIPAGTTLDTTQYHLLHVLEVISALQGKQGTIWELQEHLHSVTQHYQQLIQTLGQATPSTTEQHWNPNPLYRLSSCDQALERQEEPAQLAEQHSLPQHHDYYPDVSDEPAEVMSAWTAFTAEAHMTGAATGSNQRASAVAELRVPQLSAATGLACCQQCGAHTAQLASALVDANERVTTARAQLVAAQADINMLLGVVESQQQQLQAAATTQQELLQLLAQQGMSIPHHATQAAAPIQLGPQEAQWPVSASGGSNHPDFHSTWSSSTASKCSTQQVSTTGSRNSTMDGLVNACAGDGTGQWAVTVQPPGDLGTQLNVTIKRSRLCGNSAIGGSSVSTAGFAAACSLGSSTPSAACCGTDSSARRLGYWSGCRLDDKEQGQCRVDAVVDGSSSSSELAAPGLPHVYGHNSSFSCSLQSNKLPEYPCLRDSQGRH